MTAIYTQWKKARDTSPWLDDLCTKNPELEDILTRSDVLNKKFTYKDYLRNRPALEKTNSKTDVMRELRSFRNQQMARLIFRDFNRLVDYKETCHEASLLAECCLKTALDWSYQKLCGQFGVPRDKDGKQQYMTILGMGKLGGSELNLSSDIDLIFCYQKEGETDKRKNNSEFFEILGQEVISLLHKKTVDGFVYRVDTRLRPFGENAILALNFSAMENYYQSQGRAWERYALLKARPVAGDIEAGRKLLKILRPFIYRRYLDFGTLESLREIHQKIKKQLPEKESFENIKLGIGGIRQLEFIVQFFQLTFGGKDIELQVNKLTTALEKLQKKKYITSSEKEKLLSAWGFLRNTENALQGYEDKQTQTLPRNKSARQALIAVMGFENWETFYMELEKYRKYVQDFFSKLTAEIKTTEGNEWEDLWKNSAGEEDAYELISRSNFQDAHQALRNIFSLREGKKIKHLSDIGRQRLDKFMPLFLHQVAKQENPDTALANTVPIIDNIVLRSSYLSLLSESTLALRRLVDFCGKSSKIAEQLYQQPTLIDDFLSPTIFETVPGEEELEESLINVTNSGKKESEQFMEDLRQFRASQELRIRVQNLHHILPLDKVDIQLSLVASVLLRSILDYCQKQLRDQYGMSKENGDFIIVGYGKLGSYELGPNSDLDLLFLYDSPPEGMTDGEKSIENATFFTRLGQRILHCIRTPTSSGILYEIDTRLRPSGASGMLVSNMDAFVKYQKEQAWTWEHQALARARFVAGSKKLGAHFEKIRKEILSQKRPLTELKNEVLKMKAAVEKHHHDKKNDIKFARGGVMDMEFIAQYLVLAYAHKYPKLAEHRNTSDLLQYAEECGILPICGDTPLSQLWSKMRKKLLQETLFNTGGGQEETYDILTKLAIPYWQSFFKS